MPDLRTLTARWVFPVAGPPLLDGTVTVRGDQIEAVEPHGRRQADESLGNVAILPGFVNCHTHLDLSGMRGKCPPGPDFCDWLRGVIAFRRGRPGDQISSDTAAGMAEAMRSGTVLVGDISSGGHTWHQVAIAPLRSIVFRELIGLMDERSKKEWDELTVWLSCLPTNDRWRTGISPHAPYSVSSSLFGPSVWRGVPVSIHLAESTEELELLGERTGPFESFLKELGAWAPQSLVRSVEEVLESTQAGVPVLYVHCNYLKPEAPIPPNASIIYCPRTHAAFGHPPHPFREFLARGVRVALGTDSLASNPDLDILAEARFIRKKHPDVTGETLLRMLTLSGAEALGWADETGSLAAGKSADLVVLPLPDEDRKDPHDLIFESDLPVARTLWRGQWRQAQGP